MLPLVLQNMARLGIAEVPLYQNTVSTPEGDQYGMYTSVAPHEYILGKDGKITENVHGQLHAAYSFDHLFTSLDAHALYDGWRDYGQAILERLCKIADAQTPEDLRPKFLTGIQAPQWAGMDDFPGSDFDFAASDFR